MIQRYPRSIQKLGVSNFEGGGEESRMIALKLICEQNKRGGLVPPLLF